MAISMQEVEEIAELAKLKLSDEEKALLREQLSEILEYADMLQQVDTSGIPPTASALPRYNVTRPDMVTPSLSTEAALFNAPEAEDHQFKVRAVLD